MSLYKFAVSLCIFFSLNVLYAQNSCWNKIPLENIDDADLFRNVKTCTSYSLQVESFNNLLKSNLGEPVTMKLPGVNGTEESFKIWEAPIMQKGLAAKYPQIKTYLIQNINEPTEHGRLSITSGGLKAYIRSTKESYFIQPIGKSITTYAVFKKSDRIQHQDFKCIHKGEVSSLEEGAAKNNFQLDGVLRTYRLAVSTTGEYTFYHGGNRAEALEAIVETVNQVNVVYENDFSIRFILIDDTDALINLDADEDPFDNNSAQQMLSENTAFINSRVDADSYDIGHVFATSGAGLASLRSLCRNNKAQATTGIFPPEGNTFAIDYVAHELGHQLGSNHTFNNCDGQEVPNVAYEPGSGSTIMAYAGLCGSNNVQSASDDYFHVSSLIQISNNLNGSQSNCAQETDTGNNIPTVEAGVGNFFIPISTPFMLTAQANDIDEDALTYCWEQYDKGPQSTLGIPQGNAPSFRSLKPTTNPTRLFPRLSVVVAGASSNSEVLPKLSRDFTFQCTVRDNKPGGGAVAWDDISFKATDEAGPFIVTSQNEGNITWETNNPATVTWDVANTDQTPVNCQKVNIFLSKNLGQTFELLLAENVDNTGSATFIVPDEAITNIAYVQVVAADNIFFNTNRRRFKVVEGTVSSQNIAFEQNITLYPNPSDGKMRLKMNDLNHHQANLDVIDARGQTLKSILINSSEQDLNLNFPDGIYFLKITQDQKIAFKKILLMN